MLNRKVYVVDYELLSPIAIGASNIYESIQSNCSADRDITHFNLADTPFKKAAYIEIPLNQFYADEPKQTQYVFKYDRKFELIAACYGIGKERFDQLASIVDPKRTGLILGVGAFVPPLFDFLDELIGYSQKGFEPIKELLSNPRLSNTRINLINNSFDIYSIYLASKFNAAAFQKTILTACVSSTQAIAFGYDAVKSGLVDVCIVGGTDSLVSEMSIFSFSKLGIISESKDNISCKPFDKNRVGTLAGEAAGIAVLVSEDFLLKNNLTPKAEILGFGNTLDGYKITAPDPGGDMMTQAIIDAMANAGLLPGDIDYINAHGTGTMHNDELELNCIKKAMGDSAFKIPVSSTKDRHGHAIAAAGIQEFCFLLEMMKNQIIAANLNLEKPCDQDMDLPRENRRSYIRYALSNNFAFGGINTVLALKNEME